MRENDKPISPYDAIQRRFKSRVGLFNLCGLSPRSVLRGSSLRRSRARFPRGDCWSRVSTRWLRKNNRVNQAIQILGNLRRLRPCAKRPAGRNRALLAFTSPRDSGLGPNPFELPAKCGFKLFGSCFHGNREGRDANDNKPQLFQGSSHPLTYGWFAYKRLDVLRRYRRAGGQASTASFENNMRANRLRTSTWFFHVAD